jgi:hypothetical protein
MLLLTQPRPWLCSRPTPPILQAASAPVQVLLSAALDSLQP